MTDDVGRMVLRDNYEQNVLLGNARKQSHAMLTVHQRFIRSLETRGALNRVLEFLPDDATLAAARRRRARPHLARSSRCWSPTRRSRSPRTSSPPTCRTTPGSPGRCATTSLPQLVERYGDRLASHPLRREIITTCLVNEMVNRGGITFAFRAQEETARLTGAGGPGVHGRAARSSTCAGSWRRWRRSTTWCRPTPRRRSTWRSAGCWTARSAGSCRPGPGSSTSVRRSPGSGRWSPSWGRRCSS